MTKRKDLTGNTYGELEVLGYSHNDPNSRTPVWLCRCSCGTEKEIAGYALEHGHYKSCGCKRDEKRDKGLIEHIKQDAVDGTRKSALKAKLHKGNKSGHKGVSWMDSRQKWKAYIGVKGKQITLGYFESKADAIAARKAAEEKYHKPYLKTKNKSGVLIDLTGKRFNRLKVIKRAQVDKKDPHWECVCDCGEEIIVNGGALRHGYSQSCGCLGIERRREKTIVDIAGKRFGNLVAIKPVEGKSKKQGVYWLCKCDCGNEHTVLSHNLRYGMTKSCGCLRLGYTKEKVLDTLANALKVNGRMTKKEIENDKDLPSFPTIVKHLKVRKIKDVWNVVDEYMRDKD